MQEDEWKFRPMKEEDLDRVLAIIEDHDEDDFEWAQESYKTNGMDDQYVQTFGGHVAGVTGFREASFTENTYWLSWTYLDEKYRGQNKGVKMLENLFEILKKKNARKIFVSTSDYVDPEDGPIYEKAIRLYKSMGFKEEIIHRDYYQPGESELIFGYNLNPGDPPKEIEEDKRGIELHNISQMFETLDVYFIDWGFTGKKSFDKNDLNELLEKARSQSARSVYISFPSNIYQVNQCLESCGFHVCGRLEDYFKNGLHEIHFCYSS